jgi:nucleoside-diphosphate-sugar epimerase
MKKILVTGAVGQIGSELTLALRERYGADNVVAGGRKTAPSPELRDSGPFEWVDCTNLGLLNETVKKYKIDTMYHLPALLSAVAEAKPQMAWHVNINGLYNALEVCREQGCAIFVPSSIGAFGLSTPLDNTPQDTIQRPNTMYGVTKVAGELLCDYYYKRFGVDARGVRYPGIISNVTLPGGGTTDYAVAIYYEAVKGNKFTCYLKAGTYLDMMYMPDAIKAMIQLMEADGARLIHRNAFNITAMNFTPAQLAEEIKKHIPEFQIDYQVDPVRQEIADSWPNYMDDTAAREEWGWKPEYDIEAMTTDMLEKLSRKAGSARAKKSTAMKGK